MTAIVEKNSLIPLEHEMTVYDNMAKQAVSSKFYRNIGDASAVMSIMLSARELGISPMTAINGGLNIIQGKVEISARIMNALIRRAGHSIQTHACTDEVCKLAGKRKDNGDSEEVVFTIEDAKRAGLYKQGGGWSKFPSDMLFARALSRLARRLFPDVIGCAYIEGEISNPQGKAEVIKEDPFIEVKPSISKEDEEMINGFSQQFEGDDQKLVIDYVKLVNEKFSVSVEEIINRYHTNATSFKENFTKWKKQLPSK